MEDASILEPPRIRADSRPALERALNEHLLRRSRGSHWLGELGDDAYTVDVHYAYYVHEPGRTRCIHDHYPRLVTVPVKRNGSTWETRLPSMVQVRDRYHEAQRLYDQTILEASSMALGPIVADVGRTAGHLAKFESIYVNRFQRGERLFPSKGLKPEYLVYLEMHNIIEGDDERGYVPTKETQNYIKDFRKQFPQVDENHATEASPIPFLSLCLRDWQFLGDELRLTTLTSYFRLLTSIFDHHYRARAKPDAPEEHPVSLDGIKRRMARLGWGQPTDDDLRPRLQHLRNAGAIDYEDDYIVHMQTPWYKRAFDEARQRLSEPRQGIVLAS